MKLFPIFSLLFAALMMLMMMIETFHVCSCGFHQTRFSFTLFSLLSRFYNQRHSSNVFSLCVEYLNVYPKYASLMHFYVNFIVWKIVFTSCSASSYQKIILKPTLFRFVLVQLNVFHSETIENDRKIKT